MERIREAKLSLKAPPLSPFLVPSELTPAVFAASTACTLASHMICTGCHEAPQAPLRVSNQAKEIDQEGRALPPERSSSRACIREMNDKESQEKEKDEELNMRPIIAVVSQVRLPSRVLK